MDTTLCSFVSFLRHLGPFQSTRTLSYWTLQACQVLASIAWAYKQVLSYFQPRYTLIHSPKPVDHPASYHYQPCTHHIVYHFHLSAFLWFYCGCLNFESWTRWTLCWFDKEHQVVAFGFELGLLLVDLEELNLGMARVSRFVRRERGNMKSLHLQIDRRGPLDRWIQRSSELVWMGCKLVLFQSLLALLLQMFCF